MREKSVILEKSDYGTIHISDNEYYHTFKLPNLDGIAFDKLFYNLKDGDRIALVFSPTPKISRIKQAIRKVLHL